MLRLRFKYNPEYITIGQRVVINELKLIGRVKEIYYWLFILIIWIWSNLFEINA